MTVVGLRVELGYHVEEETHTLLVEQAQDLLLTKKQRRYTRAERDDFTVSLTQQYIRCPYCNHRFYTYPRQMNRAFDRSDDTQTRVGKQAVLDWTSQQLTFFGDGYTPLPLSRTVEVTEDLTCPHCKNTMMYSEESRWVELRHHRHKVSVRAEVQDIKELFALPCLTGGAMRVEFPLFEVVCFNFRNGHCYLRLETAEGRCVAVRDVTSDKHAWTAGAVHRVITDSKYVRRVLRNMFCKEWGSDIPFCTAELGVNELRMLTMFVGYDREFYATIPFGKDSLGVEESFAPQAHKMRHAQNLVDLYQQSSLPRMKSVRKLFFSQTGLFFYLEECSRLWRILQDPNHFVALLSRRDTYQMLSDLHMRPMLFAFLEDYGSVNGTKRLVKLIRCHWHALCRYAVNYGSMSPSMRKQEQVRWKNHQNGSVIGDFPGFAIPMARPTKRILNCVIDGYEFYWLKTSMDYEEAGQALNNCLVEWSAVRAPVVCIRKDGCIIAAMEVRGDYVFQAFTANNSSIGRNPELLKVYRKWRAKNRITDTYVPPEYILHGHAPELEDEAVLPL